MAKGREVQDGCVANRRGPRLSAGARAGKWGRRIVAHARYKQPKEHPSACDARRDDGQIDSLKMAKTGWVDKTLQVPRIGLARGRRRGGENEPPSCSPHRIVTPTAK